MEAEGAAVVAAASVALLPNPEKPPKAGAEELPEAPEVEAGACPKEKVGVAAVEEGVAADPKLKVGVAGLGDADGGAPTALPNPLRFGRPLILLRERSSKSRSADTL